LAQWLFVDATDDQTSVLGSNTAFASYLLLHEALMVELSMAALQSEYQSRWFIQAYDCRTQVPDLLSEVRRVYRLNGSMTLHPATD
jgi:hypothetical protein